MLNKLYTHRFQLFFFSIVCVLFGSIFFPEDFFTNRISPILFLVNFLSGILFFIKKKKKVLIVSFLFLIVFGVSLFIALGDNDYDYIQYTRLIAYFVFYCLVTYQIIREVWNAKRVNRSVIFGLMSGYIALGLISFFTFFSIELAAPGSFNGISPVLSITEKVDDMLYYSYITILTIGYGDITPVTNISQKATMMFGIIGQFYMVIITAVVIEKYIRHSQKD